VSSAGVSVGARDLVRQVVETLGTLDFWRVNVRPGKPLAFGQVQGKPFFGLPGNPVSALVTFDLFVRPALCALAGLPHAVPVAQAVLEHDVETDGRRTYMRVLLRREQGALLAASTGTQSSGALRSLVLADALLVLPEGLTEAKAGTAFEVRLFRPLEWIQ
jgi:molybdopterin molybdotransferase